MTWILPPNSPPQASGEGSSSVSDSNDKNSNNVNGRMNVPSLDLRVSGGSRYSLPPQLDEVGGSNWNYEYRSLGTSYSYSYTGECGVKA